MVEHARNEPLQGLLIDLCRSLLQYTGDCWPWTPFDSDTERRRVAELREAQHQRVRRLAEILAEREPLVDFGAYPTEFTDYHYVSLDYLLHQLTANQQRVVARAEEALNTLGADPQVQSLLQEIVAEEQKTLAALQELKQQCPAA